MIVLPHLDAEQCGKGQHQQHKEDCPGIDEISTSVLVFDLHVAPVDIIGSVGIPNRDGVAVDGQELGIFLVLLDEVVAVVLVLEGDKGFSREVSQFEPSHLVRIAHIKLTQFHILLIEVVYLIGNVLQQSLLFANFLG